MTRQCGFCRQRYRVRVHTDGDGGTYEDPCPCTDRRLRGVCKDCPAAVEGTVGKALRCARCKARARREASARWKKRNPEQHRKTQARQNRKRRTAKARARRRKYERERRNRPEVKARRKKNRRRNAVRNPDQKARHARAYKARHPERVKAQQDAANAKRAAAKRKYMHDYATKYVGVDCDPPTCRSCGGEVPYDGRGRPRLDCPECRGAS